mmetsp:Transcript_19775/g.23981  ORF Transcript_19775/g.23981 Transcript_19775/m.23981 type:complete len:82 (+) Transcript_19775:193-438(+)
MSISPEQQQQYLQQLRQEVATATLQEMLQKINEKCFAKCVTKPGSSLSSSEQRCLAYCVDRYQDCQALVGQTFIQRGERGG